MSYQVIDRSNRVITLEDGVPVPDGCRLVMQVELMDSLQRSVADAADERFLDEMFSDGGGEDRITDAEVAYAAMTRRLDYRGRRRSQEPDPSWTQPGWRPSRARGSAVSPQPLDAASRDAAVNDAAARAYDQRSRDMSTRWKKKKSYGAGPWSDGASSSSAVRPSWSADGLPPALVGPTGAPAANRVQHADAREEAWRRMVDSVSTRWKTHRKAAPPHPGVAP
jgi:hypothetical protein